MADPEFYDDPEMAAKLFEELGGLRKGRFVPLEDV